MPTVFFIDPGSEETAWCWFNGTSVMARKAANEALLSDLEFNSFMEAALTGSNLVGIEMVACYGMPVGASVFDTAVWIGRFFQVLTKHPVKPQLVFRKDIKMHLCGTMKAKDSNIIQALKDRFGDKGTKKAPGFFYGFSKDQWQAFAGCVYLYDMANRKV